MDKLPLRVFAQPQEASWLWGDFDVYLWEKRGIDPAFAVEHGWYPSVRAKDTYPRIVIPALDSLCLGFWQARSLFDNEPRYQSPTGNRGGSVVVTCDWVRQQLPIAVITEGAFDALAVSYVTGQDAVATMGNTPSQAALEFIVSLCQLNKKKGVVILPDKDDVAFSVRLSRYLLPHGLEVRRLLLPYKDVCRIPVSERAELLRPICAWGKTL